MHVGLRQLWSKMILAGYFGAPVLALWNLSHLSQFNGKKRDSSEIPTNSNETVHTP